METDLGRKLSRAAVVTGLTAALLISGCQDTDRNSSPTGTASSNEATTVSIEADPVITKVTDPQWARMKAVGMWRPGCPATQEDLRRVEVAHYRFDGSVTRGVLVVNRDVADAVADIFTELFVAEFPIRRMRPVEAYQGDANASLADDNTSAYNCRRPDQINAPPLLSPHANGRAIDINPRENPWMDLRCDCWFPSDRFAARTKGPGKILQGGLVWQLFKERDWVWQNIKVPDYMHFDTGYPSSPYQQP